MTDKTYAPRQKDIKQKWHFIDADGKVLGKVAVDIAKNLMGKAKPTYTTNINMGDKVVVTNAEKITVTGKKLADKTYYWHTGFPKGLKSITLGKLMEKDSSKAIVKAVTNMLPNNKLRRQRLANLYVYKGTEHPHKAQEK